VRVGEVQALFRYPIKSMRGERLDAAQLGWHGIEGDRRYALRRTTDGSGFPWLTGTKLPELLLFTPVKEPTGDGQAPTHVRTPDGAEFPLFSEELATDIARRHGSPVEMLFLRHGIFDDAPISLITSATVDEIGRLGALTTDVRRFRPNIQIASTRGAPFEEDSWIGGIVSFGENGEGGAVSIMMHDERCAMVNVDPDSGSRSPAVLKTIVQKRDNKAGVYCTVIRCGRLAVGQPVFFDHKPDSAGTGIPVRAR
jgi:uncharacterized protein YcbX